jgi:uncharacterized protein YutE (UPF0331/DUF86 family)
VVLRAEAVRERLRKLEEVISGLESLASRPPSNLRDEWATERGLQLAAELLFDIGNHILSAHFGVSAKDYEDVLEQLKAQGVIEAPLRERFRGLGGFRNILVHDYLRIDPAKVADGAARAPRDFSAFARAVADWLGRVTA